MLKTSLFSLVCFSVCAVLAASDVLELHGSDFETKIKEHDVALAELPKDRQQACARTSEVKAIPPHRLATIKPGCNAELEGAQDRFVWRELDNRAVRELARPVHSACARSPGWRAMSK